jgi:hypothetical protein
MVSWPSENIARLFPRSLQRQEQVTLASLGLLTRDQSGECAYISVFLQQSERWMWQISASYVSAAIMWPKYEVGKVSDTVAEDCQARLRGLCGVNPAIHLIRPVSVGHCSRITTLRSEDFDLYWWHRPTFRAYETRRRMISDRRRDAAVSIVYSVLFIRLHTILYARRISIYRQANIQQDCWALNFRRNKNLSEPRVTKHKHTHTHTHTNTHTDTSVTLYKEEVDFKSRAL